MKYIKIAKELKGVNIKWNNGKIFPDYKYNSGSYVSQRRINKAIKIVLAILDEEENKILKAFQELNNKRYNGKHNLKVNFKLAKEKVKNGIHVIDLII